MRRSLVGMALVWVVVVAAVSGLTWAVIDSAGRDVLTSGAPETLPASGFTSAPDGRGASPTDQTSPSRVARPRKSRPTPKPTRPAATESPTPSLTPSPPVQPPAQPAPSRAPGTTGRPPAPPKSQSPTPQGQVRSWQGAAGTVSARCTGPRISLVSASPNNGWRVSVKNRGPEEIEVEFETRGEGERSAHVRGGCSGGAPRFRTETED